MRRPCFAMVGVFLALVFLPRISPAQGIGAAGIVGVVRDASGAVLPGVTVEAASPVLIERVRTTVTDGEGRYQIAELRPGVYSVTFSLQGFTTFRRDGLELSSRTTSPRNSTLALATVWTPARVRPGVRNRSTSSCAVHTRPRVTPTSLPCGGSAW